MSRLPTPGSDDGTWGDILNDYLSVEHNADGTQKTLDVTKLVPGSNGDVLTSSSGAVTWAAPGGGGSPSGAAGGSLAGTYPNPTIASGAITTTEIADGTITNTDVSASAAIAYSKLNLAGDIVNADISASAAIAKSKLAGLSIVDADVSAISESKITGLTSDLAATEKTANKGAASGYAGLDGSSKVPIANLPTGSSSTTVAIGNDSRITGAIPASTATTKGDILAASASATIARLGVGSDGTVLTADSTQTTGVKWASAAADNYTSQLTWAPPQLSTPTIINVTSSWNNLDLNTDYILNLPTGSPLAVSGGLQIVGGRNIVLIGGEIEIPASADPASPSNLRGLIVENSTGTVHIEGLRIYAEGGGIINEGIDIAAPSAIVQLQNIRVENVTRPDIQHNDIVQPWGGVQELRIDKLTGSSTYQGLFLAGSDGAVVERAFIRRVNIIGENVSPNYQQFVWFDPNNGTGQADLDEVYIDLPSFQGGLGSGVWPQSNDATYPLIVAADGSGEWVSQSNLRGRVKPASLLVGGDFVPASGVGIGYVSPGYLTLPASLNTKVSVNDSLLQQTALFAHSGALVTSIGQGRFRFSFPVTIINVIASVGTAPTGAAIICDVDKNGTTIFTTQANRPSIAISSNSTASAAIPDVTSFTSGDYLTVDVDQVGSTITGSDLTVQVLYIRTG